MATVPSATTKGVYDGVLKWYDGDTFELSFTLTLTDVETNTSVIIGANDIITLTIYHYGREIITRTYTGIVHNTISLDIDTDITEMMPQGTYSYTIRLNDGYVDTIVDENRIEVL